MRTSEQYRECVEALRVFAQGAGFSDVVIGLSGGMDSSLVAVMCVEAFGTERVHGVLLPGPYSSNHSVEDAQDLAERLGIETQTVSVLDPYRAFEKVLASACGGALTGIAAQNTQARCRMVCLMALSNAYGWMLVNTGNKSEAMMGYSTLYGDTAGAFAPIGGLYKTEVYSVARWRNDHEQGSGALSPIPERVFLKPPSAELAPGQDDETSMGIDYSTLDALLKAHVEHGLNAAELCDAGFEASSVRHVLDTIRATTFKRDLEPPYPRADFYR
ncbi:MAG: NAD(+) synthase [Gordonibacter sp.]|nr:NAD(+) synthase [Gordonibacter sp.]